MPKEIDLKKLGVYLVEGVVEIDPMTEKLTIRTVDPKGNSLDFDPMPVLQALKGQEMRIVISPLASIAYLESVAQEMEAQVADPPKSDPSAN